LLQRGFIQTRSSAGESFDATRFQRPFWNAGRVLLFSAVTGTTTYFYGVNEDPHRLQLPWFKTSGPQYATKKELEKVFI